LKKKSSNILCQFGGSIFAVHRYGYPFYFLFALLLPIHTATSNFFLIVALAFCLYGHYRSNSFERPKTPFKTLFFSVLTLFLLHVLGLFYTDYLLDSFRFIERTLSFLLVPIAFLFFNRVCLRKIRKSLLQGLLVGSVISILILTVLNVYKYLEGQEALHLGPDLFDYYHTYLNFTDPLNQHPTYLGIYYLTAIIFLDEVVQKKVIKYFLIILFGIGFLFLNSRIIFIILILLMGYRTFYKIRKYVLNKEFVKLAIVSLAFVPMIFLYFKFVSDSYIVSRFKNIYDFEISTEAEENFNSHAKSNPRMARYISALKLVNERPFFGYGTGDEGPNLMRQFKKDGLFFAVEQNYNSHNQYIGYAIRFGLFGVGILLFFLIANSYLAFREKEYNYLLFIFVIAFVNLVENYFNRNYGITFSAIFFTTFTYQILKSPKTRKSSS